MNRKAIAQELVAVARELTAADLRPKADAPVRDLVEAALGHAVLANKYMALVMQKSRYAEAEEALSKAGGRHELQKVWNNLTRVTQDLRAVERKTR